MPNLGYEVPSGAGECDKVAKDQRRGGQWVKKRYWAKSYFCHKKFPKKSPKKCFKKSTKKCQKKQKVSQKIHKKCPKKSTKSAQKRAQKSAQKKVDKEREGILSLNVSRSRMKIKSHNFQPFLIFNLTPKTCGFT